MKLSIDSRPHGQREIRLTLRGEIDYASAQDLRFAITAALDQEAESIVVSLAGVTFIDSNGIGTLVVARRICHDLRVRLQVTDANPFVARLFAVVGVSEALGLPTTSGGVTVPARRGGTAEPVTQNA